MSVRLANPKNDATTGAGHKPCPLTESILGVVARERELGGDHADTSGAEPGRRDLMVSRPKSGQGSNRQPGSNDWNPFARPRRINRDHTGRDHG